MHSKRLQHLIPGSLILLLAAIVAWLSFTREPADAFLFPRLIASVMLVLAVWNFARAAAGIARVGSGIDMRTVLNLLPGLVIMLVFVFYAARALGFYAASTLAFFCLFSLYDPAPHKSAMVWVKRAFISIAFMAIIYCLFSLLLKVQTPRGAFI